ncbi:MAG: DMT family transporter [Lachnospiraceae bacterium]|nr:DMT family transporter [Lachnospiraceae bacterium]
MKNKKMQGIIYIIFAGFFFSLMTFFVKISGDLPTMQKAFFRNAVAAVAAVIMLARSEEGFKIKKTSWPGLFMRSFCGSLGLICNFYAIDKLGLADSNILNKLSPFFAIIFSVFILKEKANKVEWLSVIVAFIGAAFVIKPSMQITSFYGFIGMLGGLGAGIAYTFVRLLGKKGERGPVIVMCFSIFSCMITLPFMIINFKPMSPRELICLLLAGCAATGGQLCITTAYTKAPAREISVFDYTQILFAALLGIFFLNEIPDKYSLIGYTIIIGIAIFKWWYTVKRKPAA